MEELLELVGLDKVTKEHKSRMGYIGSQQAPYILLYCFSLITQFDKGLNVSHGNRGKWKERLLLSYYFYFNIN